MSPFSIAFGVLLLTAVVWKLRQVTRAPHDLPLRAVTFCLVSAAIAFPFGLPAGARWADSLIAPGTAKWLQNVMLLVAVYWLMCFYLFSAEDAENGRRRARWELLPLAFSIAAITAATLATPPALRGHTFSTGDMSHTAVAAFYFFGGLYLFYAIAMALRSTLRYAGSSRRPLSTGLRIAAVGMAAMVLASGVRSVLVVIRWQSGTPPAPISATASLVLMIAIPLFVIGVIYPSVATRWAAGRVWWQHRRQYHQLRPLWTLLHDAYPEHVLGRVPSAGRRDLLSLRAMHRRYYRRVIECRDGLVWLSPYLAQERARTGLPSDQPARPAELAGLLRAALHARAEGKDVDARASRVAMPAGEGLEDDVRELIDLADALRAQPA
ncbi:MAB_1171c family putative transporter [Amycolatopsis palatopharyngis]|uniref:MAB_1171c family putative transporter n=1 Tax=Amycolatopsis palatopharyngis TaxID=187982 RepID=UPI000E25777C|nr:MAB_1171c family putative transporter [Amycolatopsis palatopharyngis]